MSSIPSALNPLALILIGAWLGFILGDFTGMLVGAFFGWIAHQLVDSTTPPSR